MNTIFEIISAFIPIICLSICFIGVPLCIIAFHDEDRLSSAIVAIVLSIIWVTSFVALQYFMYRNFQISLNEKNFCDFYDYGVMAFSCNIRDNIFIYIIAFVIFMALWALSKKEAK